MILCGDFFQLPPINKKRRPDDPEGLFYNRSFAFESSAWRNSGMESILLKEVFRQRDREFVTILNAIRHGDATAAMPALMQKCQRPLP
mmetsp:Transcript_25053/g.69965  ORF Transcript_25053/g.69965 Transcript_25053/m.69965 type:complete len:88 (+) Transcript_25053:1126-1389(+)